MVLGGGGEGAGERGRGREAEGGRNSGGGRGETQKEPRHRRVFTLKKQNGITLSKHQSFHIYKQTHLT